MIPIYQWPGVEAGSYLEKVGSRGGQADGELQADVAAILASVREKGDAALREWTRRLDGFETRLPEDRPRGDSLPGRPGGIPSCGRSCARLARILPAFTAVSARSPGSLKPRTGSGWGSEPRPCRA